MDDEKAQSKEILPFLQRADEVAKAEPKVAYYCRMYAVELAMGFKTRGPKMKSLLEALMTKLEKDKPSATLSDNDEEYCRQFAETVFARADKVDRAGRATKSTALTFYAAGFFIEMLKHFGELPPELADMQRYAAWKAADINKALREGRTPTPGNGEAEPADLQLPGAPSTKADLEQIRPPPSPELPSVPTVQPPQHFSDGSMPHQHAGAPQLPTMPSSGSEQLDWAAATAAAARFAAQGGSRLPPQPPAATYQPPGSPYSPLPPQGPHSPAFSRPPLDMGGPSRSGDNEFNHQPSSGAPAVGPVGTWPPDAHSPLPQGFGSSISGSVGTHSLPGSIHSGIMSPPPTHDADDSFGAAPSIARSASVASSADQQPQSARLMPRFPPGSRVLYDAFDEPQPVRGTIAKAEQQGSRWMYTVALAKRIIQVEEHILAPEYQEGDFIFYGGPDGGGAPATIISMDASRWRPMYTIRLASGEQREVSDDALLAPQPQAQSQQPKQLSVSGPLSPPGSSGPPPVHHQLPPPVHHAPMHPASHPASAPPARPPRPAYPIPPPATKPHAAHPQPSPVQPRQPYEPVAGFTPGLTAITEAQKCAKYAASSLGFEDVASATKYLNDALRLLTRPSGS